MNDNEVKNAFDYIEPEPGAQERMYANILKKAAAQREDQNAEENIEEKQPSCPAGQRWPTHPVSRGQAQAAARYTARPPADRAVESTGSAAY